MKLDYKKKYPEYYNPKRKIEFVNIPEMKFFMIDGQGDPNNKEFKNAMEAIYALSYNLKMKIVKKEKLENDYVVPPLEGLWHKEDMSTWSIDDKDSWEWTIMIRIPDYVSENQIDRAFEIVKNYKNPTSLSKIRVDKYNEGNVAQIMYVGPYSEEGSTIQKLHQAIIDKGFQLFGKHHEIYISDPRRVDASRLKTIIRQPYL